MFDWIVSLIESIGFEACVGIAAAVCVLFDINHLGPAVFEAISYIKETVLPSEFKAACANFLAKSIIVCLPLTNLNVFRLILSDKFCFTNMAFLNDLSSFMARIAIVAEDAALAVSSSNFGGVMGGPARVVWMRSALDNFFDAGVVVINQPNFSWLGWFAVAAAIAVGLFLITAAIKKKEPEVSSVKNTVSLKAVREAEPRLFSYSSRRISNIELGDVQPAVHLDTEQTLQLAISDFFFKN